MQETTFFENGDVKVTNARFVSGSQTYAMNNVTSVKPFEEKPKRFWLILLLIAGVVVAAGNSAVGVAMIVVAAALLYFQKTTYHVLLATSGGETKALRTFEREYLNRVVSALNEAIVHRG